jgi:hypothetical protein
VRPRPGKEARLCFAAHAAMEKRYGLCLLLDVTSAAGAPDVAIAVDQVTELHYRGFIPKPVGGDKGYHLKGSSAACAKGVWCLIPPERSGRRRYTSC